MVRLGVSFFGEASSLKMYRTLKAMSEELNINRPVTSSLEDSKRPSLRVFGC